MRILFVFCIIAGDICANIYIPKLAQSFLETSFQNAIIWGVIWYSLLRTTTECTTYLLSLITFPFLNQVIQDTQFALCKKWHTQPFSVKTGEMLTYFRRIGSSFRIFYRRGILTFIPAVYKLLIALSVFYSIRFIDFKGMLLMLCALLFPLLWLPAILPTPGVLGCQLHLNHLHS